MWAAIKTLLTTTATKQVIKISMEGSIGCVSLRMLVDFYSLIKSFRLVRRVIQSHSDSLYRVLVMSNFSSADDV